MHRRTAAFLLIVIALLTTEMGFANAPAETESEARVFAYYFHGHFRCQTCLKIEGLAQYCITETLASDIESGELAWQVANFQKKEFEHFAEIFKIEGPCLIIARYSDQKLMKWTNLEKVWDLTEDSKAFDAYLVGTVRKYLETASLQASP